MQETSHLQCCLSSRRNRTELPGWIKGLVDVCMFSLCLCGSSRGTQSNFYPHSETKLRACALQWMILNCKKLYILTNKTLKWCMKLIKLGPIQPTTKAKYLNRSSLTTFRYYTLYILFINMGFCLQLSFSALYWPDFLSLHSNIWIHTLYPLLLHDHAAGSCPILEAAALYRFICRNNTTHTLWMT